MELSKDTLTVFIFCAQMSQKQCAVFAVRHTVRTPDSRWKSCPVWSGTLSTPCTTWFGKTAATLNDGRRYGKLGEIFFQLLHSKPFVKLWHHDGLQIVHVEMPNHAKSPQKWDFTRPKCSSRFTTSENEDMSRTVVEKIYGLFINRKCAECHGIDTMSIGSISAHLNA